MTADPSKYVAPRPPAMVVWFPSPGMDHTNAIVTKIGKEAINLAVIPPESRSLLVKEGVKYVHDPRIKIKGWDPEAGLWDYTSEHKQLMDLISEFMAPSEK